MRNCEHDKVFSGRTNLQGSFEWICARCGELGWSETYEIHRVNQDAYYASRVSHGWGVPKRNNVVRLPAPPRLPTLPVRETRWVGPMVFNGVVFLSAVAFGTWCAFAYPDGVRLAAVGAALALFGLTVSIVGWRKNR